jgi:2-oxoglutarate ferredoxin oxidoreductase subunit alpha
LPVPNARADYQALIVSYGTMSRVCRTAIDRLMDEDIPVGMVRPKTLFPFPGKALREADRKTSCRVVTSIEMSMGQMVEDVKLAVAGKRPVSWFGKCGGEIPTPQEVMDFIKNLLIETSQP